jgi:hypothetical protein
MISQAFVSANRQAKAVETLQVVNDTRRRPRGLRSVSAGQVGCSSGKRDRRPPAGGIGIPIFKRLRCAPEGRCQFEAFLPRRRRPSVPVDCEGVSFTTRGVSTASAERFPDPQVLGVPKVETPRGETPWGVSEAAISARPPKRPGGHTVVAARGTGYYLRRCIEETRGSRGALNDA